MINDPKNSPKRKAGKTYFGIAALIIGILTDLFLGANFGVAYLKISLETFDRLNNLTALFYCIFTQMTLLLGIIGYTRRNDSRPLSGIAIATVSVPFAVLFTQFVFSFTR